MLFSCCLSQFRQEVPSMEVEVMNHIFYILLYKNIQWKNLTHTHIYILYKYLRRVRNSPTPYKIYYYIYIIVEDFDCSTILEHYCKRCCNHNNNIFVCFFDQI